jgi:hypothetical protein
MDDVGLDGEVVVKKLGRTRVVGENAADFCRRQEQRIGLGRGQPRFHLDLTAHVEVLAVGGEDFAAFRAEPAYNRASGHAFVTGHHDALAGEREHHFSHRCAPAYW